MILNVYTVRDSAIDAYLAPFTARGHNHAIRMFTHEANRPGSEIGKSKTDYELFYVGTFSEETGELNYIKPQSIIRATDIPAQE